MKKKHTNFVIMLLSIILVIYFGIAFILWEFNPAFWSARVRVSCLALGVIAGLVLVTFIYALDIKGNQTN